jgi:hypothetical protein
LPISSKIAEGLRVRKVIPDNIPADWLGQFGECKTAIATWTETSKMNLVDYGSYAR